MSSLIKSATILAFARFTNYSLLLLSPVFLVRFLDTTTFGQYREFVVYATLFSALAAFSVNTNLLYFIPKDHGRARTYVSNTIWMVLCASFLSCLIIAVFREPLLARTSFDFFIPLCIYILLFTNFDFLESYWLAGKEPGRVFYYSVARTTVRLIAVLITAIYMPTAEALINTLIVVEAVRVLAVFMIMWRIDLMLARIDRRLMKRQLTFVVPLGLAASLHYINEYVGPISVSTQLGVVALAIYTIGSYQVPILSIIRGSIIDSIFPDMVREASRNGVDRLRLWNRSIVAYSFLIVPVVVLLFCYADILIPLVFTEQYRDAVPIFKILVLVTLVQCFEFSTPLRAVNQNKTLLVGNIIMLCVNIGVIAVFFRFLSAQAIYGPAIAIVLAYVVQLAFLGRSIARFYVISISELLKWRSLAVIFFSALLSCVTIFAGELTDIPAWIRLPIFSMVFLLVYFLLIRRARLEEVEILVQALARKMRRV